MRLIPDEQPPVDDAGRTILTSAFDARTSLVRASIVCGVVALIGLALWRHGGLSGVVLAVSIMLIWAARAWLKGRPRVELDAGSITVRNTFATRTLPAEEIREVRYQFNGRSPDLRLVPQHGRSLIVPASQVMSGHAVILRWLSGAAPAASYDARAAEIRDTVVAVRKYQRRR